MSADGPPSSPGSGKGTADTSAHTEMRRSGPSGAKFAKFWMENPDAIPPSAKLLGCRPVEADPERGFCRSAFANKPEFRNPMGALQGGFVAAMLDDTMAVGGLFKIGGGYIVPTLEMKVNFVRPATTDEVFAEGWLVHAGRTIAFLGGRLPDANEEVCATATATAIIRPFKRIED
ncbi:MAG: PaaI family thioesterase [Alphaproteobacteria bacterium]